MPDPLTPRCEGCGCTRSIVAALARTDGIADPVCCLVSDLPATVDL